MSPQIPTYNFSMNRLDRAGKAFRNGTETTEDFHVLNEWRERCSAELSNVRTHVNQIIRSLEIELKREAIVSQRLKRLPTIISKLKHFPRMQLSTMQDIAGIRVVFRNSEDLSRFLARIQKGKSGFQVARDYIKEPAASGYRSIHLIKTMNSKVKVELQIRTQIQHAWATTVETSDVLFSHEGEYKRDHSIGTTRSLFFQEVSKLMAMYERGETLDQALITTVLDLDQEITLTKRVRDFGTALTIVNDHLQDKNRGSYWLIQINDGSITLSRGAETRKSDLIQQYTKLEEEGKQAVLVKVDDYESLQKAYPNYLGDSSRFINFIQELTY